MDAADAGGVAICSSIAAAVRARGRLCQCAVHRQASHGTRRPAGSTAGRVTVCAHARAKGAHAGACDRWYASRGHMWRWRPGTRQRNGQRCSVPVPRAGAGALCVRDCALWRLFRVWPQTGVRPQGVVATRGGCGHGSECSPVALPHCGLHMLCCRRPRTLATPFQATAASPIGGARVPTRVGRRGAKGKDVRGRCRTRSQGRLNDPGPHVCPCRRRV